MILPITQEKLMYFLFLHWQLTLKPFSVETIAAKEAFTNLVTAYSRPNRHYHTLKHIYQVVNTIDTLQVYTEDLASVKLAAWFHDIVYNTQSQDNEERSAEYAAKILENLAIPTHNIDTVHQLILNTKYHQGDDLNSQVLLDADLAILAANPVEYQEYSQAIRQEYAWVTELEYIKGRKKVLEGFLQRERIYFTPLMFESGEQSARNNLQREIIYLLNQEKQRQPN
jgi:predicted metal-dependent HD superfamily phosphohydrolase